MFRIVGWIFFLVERIDAFGSLASFECRRIIPVQVSIYRYVDHHRKKNVHMMLCCTQGELMGTGHAQQK